MTASRPPSAAAPAQGAPSAGQAAAREVPGAPQASAPGTGWDLPALVALAARWCNAPLAVLGLAHAPASECLVAVAGDGLAPDPACAHPCTPPWLAGLQQARPRSRSSAGPQRGRRLLAVAAVAPHGPLHTHPWVQGAPHLRAFAAIALLDADGNRRGTLAALDTCERRFSAAQQQALALLAEQVLALLPACAPAPAAAPAAAGAPAAVAGGAVQAGTGADAAPGARSSRPSAAEQDAAQEAQMHDEILQLQRRIFALDLDLDLQQVLRMVAQAALRLSGAGPATGAAVELLQDGQLVVNASAGLLAPPRGTGGTGQPPQHSPAWPALQHDRKLLCNDTQAAGWPHFTGPRSEPLRSALALPLRAQNAVVGFLKVVAGHSGAFSARCVAHLEVLAETLGSVVQLRHLTEQLEASQKQYKLLFDAHPQAMWVHALDGAQRILAANHAMVALYGYSEEALLRMGSHQLLALQCTTESTAPDALRPLPQDAVRRRYCLQDGRVMEAEVFSHAIRFNGIAACQVVVTDVTEQMRAGRELARLSRAQQLLSLCNEALVRTPSETALLHTVCRMALDTGGYRMAWAGLVDSNAEQRTTPVAHAGLGTDCLEGISALVLPRLQLHPGEHTVLVCSVAAAAEGEDLRRLLQAQGICTVVSLTLQHQHQVFGLLRLYTDEAPDFSAQELQLLQKLANDMAFGIMALRTQKEQQSLHASVLKVAAAVSASTGTAFFEQLARNMAEALGAQAACIGRLIKGLPPGAPTQAESLAVVIDGEIRPNIVYTLEQTPSHRLLTQRQYLVTEQVQQRYPDAPIVQAISAQGYAGMQLQSSQGEPLGMLFVLFRQPLSRPEFALSTLQIFAARSAAELERQLADAHIRRQASLLDSAQDAILVRDLQHRVLFWNKGAERAYGWTQEEALGRHITQLIYRDADAFERATRTVLAQGAWSGEMPQQHRSGHSLDMEGRWTLVCSDDGQPESILAINTDITERKATERQIQRLAFYDALTGLPNRMLLMDRTRHALASAQRHQQGGALLFIDLDNFKTLNDTLGHDKGDLLLQRVGQRLGTCVRNIDTVARLGGDEFVVLLEGLSAEHDALVRNARDVGEKILACLSAPYDLDGSQYRSTPSIGIAPFRGSGAPHGSGHGDTVGELLKQADLAMYQAKTAGRSTLRFFDPLMQQVVVERAALETDLRNALAENQFSLHYQPQVDCLGNYTGVEALLRWKHPERGMVPPSEFIPLAEETGLILVLGRWVLHTACQRLAQWRKHPQLRHLTMAVNVSSRQFRHTGFVQDVVRVLAVTGAPSSLLKLELTESLLVEDMDATIATMTALRTYCIGFSLDDFGTGYSSLSYLKRMPLDQLKIDQSFVRDLLTDPNDAAIVNTIIGLSESLGLGVIAEGVETLAQRDMLLRAGCRCFQGYLFGRPMPADAIDAVLLQAPQ